MNAFLVIHAVDDACYFFLKDTTIVSYTAQIAESNEKPLLGNISNAFPTNKAPPSSRQTVITVKNNIYGVDLPLSICIVWSSNSTGQCSADINIPN